MSLMTGTGGGRIKKVEAKGLFGLFDHTINFHHPVTLVHGPNGVGKTVVLRMIKALFDSDFSVFENTSFAEFNVTFDDDSVIRVHRRPRTDTKKRKSRNRVHSDEIIVQFGQDKYAPIEAEPIPPHILHRLIDDIPHIVRVGQDLWFDQATGGHMSGRQIAERFRSELPQQFQSEVPEWFRKVRGRTKIRLITTGRIESVHVAASEPDLYGRRVRPQARLNVDNCAADLATLINNNVTQYAAKAQDLDRKFPSRLLQGDIDIYSVEEITASLTAIDEKRVYLQGLGFIDAERDSSIPALDPLAVSNKADVLTVYLNDMTEKLAAFDDLAAKIQLFSQNIRKRFQYKEITITKEQGITFSAHQTQVPLQVSELSSGEQHTIILFYELIFRTEPGSIVLIDEPEISLHLAWQEQFVEDIAAIAKLRDFSSLMATHSSEIIGPNWALVSVLTGP